MSRNADVYGIPSLRIVIGTTSTVKVGPFPGELVTSIKLLGGGTLEIGGYGLSMNMFGQSYITTLGGTATASVGNTFGTMYPLSTGEVFSVNSSGTYYLYASGATCEVAIAVGRSAGLDI